MQIVEIFLNIFQSVRVQYAILVKMQEILQGYLPVFVCIIFIKKIAYSVVIYWTISNCDSSNVVSTLVLSHISIDSKTIEDLCKDYFGSWTELTINNHWFDFATALR